MAFLLLVASFQSTLPYGSDSRTKTSPAAIYNFNPRSLTGATKGDDGDGKKSEISIHAPLRERQNKTRAIKYVSNFNPRSLTGATERRLKKMTINAISIHAPLRERRSSGRLPRIKFIFQSTLPYGSDRQNTIPD